MPERSPTVVCWGELVVDRAPSGAFLGGSAANVARNSAALGLAVRLVSAVGDDELGRAAVSALAEAGVDVTRVIRVPNATTASARVDVERGEPRYRPLALLPWRDLDFSAPLRAALEGADALVFALFAQTACLDLAQLSKVLRPPLCVADFGLRKDVPAAVIARAAELADVIQLDLASAERAARILEVPDAATALLGIGAVRLVVVTDGARGARLVHRTGEHGGAPARAAHPAHSVGAGDAFAAAVTAALLEGAPYAEVLARALDHALTHVESAPIPLSLGV